jgi:hypothetical protein
MAILDQKLKYFCKVCGDEIIAVSASLRSHPKYCGICRRKVKSERDKDWMRKSRKGEIQKHGNSSIKAQSKIIANIEWYNAGLYAGKQGYLRERFYELLTKHNDFLIVMEQLRDDPKWIAEIKGLLEDQRRCYMMGFFAEINKGSNYESVIAESKDD